MPLELTPLDEAQLSPVVRKAATASAPPQLRMMVARGVAPLSPPDLLTSLYQLAVGDDEPLREAAVKTASELPDGVLLGGLGAPLDPRVLEWYALALVTRDKVLPLVLGNPRTADETFAALAAVGDDALLEQVAQNEQRLLRHPAIITALYLNKRTRMSTAVRALELAVRNGVAVEGIPSFEDVKAAIEHEGTQAVDDQAFQAALAIGADVGSDVPLDEQTAEQLAEAAQRLIESAASRDEKAAETIQNIGRLSIAAKLRLASIGNAFARAQLVRDSNKAIALAAVRSPSLTEQEAEHYAANRALHEEVVRYLASQRGFTKRYSVKWNLVNNPKCPLSLGIGFLGHLTAKDLKQIARSKSVSSALVKSAQHLLAKREQKQ